MEDGYPESSIKLHLGSGKIHWDGWVNVDFNDSADIQCDLRTLPFEDNHAEVVCSIHTLEHFYQWEVVSILTEWSRVLKPGGQLILELPSMDKVFNYIADRVTKNIPVDSFMCWFAFWGDPKYKTVDMCHKWGYTYGMLKDVLTKAGFVDIKPDKARYHFPQRDMRVTSMKPLTT